MLHKKLPRPTKSPSLPLHDGRTSSSIATSREDAGNSKKRRRRRRTISIRDKIDAFCTPASFRTVVLFIALTMTLSIRELQTDDNDDVLAQVLPAWFVHWVNPELDVLSGEDFDDHNNNNNADLTLAAEAAQQEQSYLEGDTGRGGGVLHQRPFVEHEIKALIDGEEEEERAAVEMNNNNNNNDIDPPTWHNVEQLFDKKDATVQHRWWNARGLVHVVHTRLLLNKARLVDLTRARLAQFQTFTLPSLAQQTLDEFLWILWVSPNLMEETEVNLKQLLQSSTVSLPNVVVVQEKKQRYDIRHPWWEETFDQSYVLTGSYRLLMSYNAAAQQRVTLDTYLDSQDALALDFVANLQREASSALAQPTSFRVWCPSHVLEWTYASPPWHAQLQQELSQLELAEAHKAAGQNDTQITMTSTTTVVERGFFAGKRSTEKCLSSAGTTVGFGANYSSTTNSSLFQKVQSQPTLWHTTVMPCDHPGESNCLGFLRDDRHKKRDRGYELASSFAALSRAVLLRSKTIIAAETKGIAAPMDRPKPSPEAAYAAQEKMWNHLEPLYGIRPQSVQKFRESFQGNLDKILLDMLTICLPSSNACSAKNKKVLQDMLTSVGLKKVPKLMAFADAHSNSNNENMNNEATADNDEEAARKV